MTRPQGIRRLTASLRCGVPVPADASAPPPGRRQVRRTTTRTTDASCCEGGQAGRPPVRDEHVSSQQVRRKPEIAAPDPRRAASPARPSTGAPHPRGPFVLPRTSPPLPSPQGASTAGERALSPSRRGAMTAALGALGSLSAAGEAAAAAGALGALRGPRPPGGAAPPGPPPHARPPSTRGANPLGLASLHNPDTNRGLATDLETRRRSRTEGLLPPGVTTPGTEVARALGSVRAAGSPLDKYRAAMALYSTDHDAFLKLLQDHAGEVLPWVYTPTVGDACLNWGLLVPAPQGLYLPSSARGRVGALVANWPQDDVRIAVVTDGGRVLGLGDLGASGMGISIGKGLLYSACAGVHPSQVLPIALDVGTDNEALRADPLYVGQRRPRLRGPEYLAFVEEVVDALEARFGSVLVHLEDFGGGVAWDVLRRVDARGTLPVFNDDIQGTAAAVGASLLGALRVDGVPALREQRVLFYGAGQANLGAAKLAVRAMVEEGLSEGEARARIWLMDSKGLIYEGRPGLTPEKAPFAQPLGALPGDTGGLDPTSLASCIGAVLPSALVGAAAQRGAFDERVLRALDANVRRAYGRDARPVVLALSNPTSKCECTAEEALRWTGGRAVLATGTAFGPVALADGSVYHPAQANNALVFPGVGLGALASGATAVTEQMFLAAARSLAGQLSEEELARGLILPPVSRITDVALGVATAVAAAARTDMVASNRAGAVFECLSSRDGDDDGGASCVIPLQYQPYSAYDL